MEQLLYTWPLLIALGLGLRMLLRFWYGARGPDRDDPIYLLGIIFSWALLLLGIAPLALGSAFSFFGLIVIVLAIVAAVETAIERRAAQRRSMCTLLALAMERGQQLDSSLVLSDPATRGLVGRAMRKLLDALRDGTPLAAAIKRNPAALPPAAIAYVAAGRSIGAESAALRELSRADHTQLTSIWRACVDRISYLGAVLFIMITVLTFIMIKIVPEFVKIFHEFDLGLPKLTILAVSLSRFFVAYLATPILLLAALLLIASSVIVVCYLCDVHVLQFLGDRVFRSRREADVLRILAVATEQRQPMTNVFQRLSIVYPSGMVRGKLAPAAQAVSAGGDWRDALRDVRLVTSAEQSLLKTAEQAGNLPWALRIVADRKEKRTVYRLSAAVQVLYPVLIVLLGLLVGFFVVALFVPLVKLVNGLAG